MSVKINMANKKKEFKIVTCGIGPSDNHAYLFRGRLHFLSKEAKLFKESVAWLAKDAYGNHKPMVDKVSVIINFYLKRDRDLLGSDKLLMDALQGIVYVNDKQIVHAELNKFVDKEDPRVELTVIKL